MNQNCSSDPRADIFYGLITIIWGTVITRFLVKKKRKIIPNYKQTADYMPHKGPCQYTAKRKGQAKDIVYQREQSWSES